VDYFLYLNGEQSGPYSESQLVSLVISQQLERDTLAWCEGMAEWLPLDAVIPLSPNAKPANTSSIEAVQKGEGFGRLAYIFLWVVLTGLWLLIVYHGSSMLVSTIISFVAVTLAIVGITAARLQDIGHYWYWAWLTVVPVACLPIFVYCFFTPKAYASKRSSSAGSFVLLAAAAIACVIFVVLALWIFSIVTVVGRNPW
jgi:uncharacterized membrane protein YhaH (DUF805 family)